MSISLFRVAYSRSPNGKGYFRGRDMYLISGTRGASSFHARWTQPIARSSGATRRRCGLSLPLLRPLVSLHLVSARTCVLSRHVGYSWRRTGCKPLQRCARAASSPPCLPCCQMLTTRHATAGELINYTTTTRIAVRPKSAWLKSHSLDVSSCR